jgi:hypothetical protein
MQERTVHERLLEIGLTRSLGVCLFCLVSRKADILKALASHLPRARFDLLQVRFPPRQAS